MIVAAYGQCRNVSLAIMVGFFTLLMQGAVEARTLVCESINHQPQHCRADTSGGVRLVRSFSKSGCYEGETWGYDRWGVWVTDGCRAKFELGESYADPYWNRDSGNDFRPREGRRQWHDAPRTLSCESWGGRLNYCRAPLGNARVEIERQLSDTDCRLGENWGWDGGGIWVKRGCRAVFSVHGW